MFIKVIDPAPFMLAVLHQPNILTILACQGVHPIQKVFLHA